MSILKLNGFLGSDREMLPRVVPKYCTLLATVEYTTESLYWRKGDCRGSFLFF